MSALETVLPCMGGLCSRRDKCAHYGAPTERAEPAERLCQPGDEDLMFFLPYSTDGEIEMGNSVWRDKVVAFLNDHDGGVRLATIIKQIGVPESRTPPHKIMRDAEAFGWVRSEGMGETRVYFATGKISPESSRPPFKLIGRNAPRYPSVFHMARGVAA